MRKSRLGPQVLQAPTKFAVSLKPPRFVDVARVDTNSLFLDESMGERVLGVKKKLNAGCCGSELREGDRDAPIMDDGGDASTLIDDVSDVG